MKKTRHMKPGVLTKFGYNTKNRSSDRHHALNNAISVIGRSSVLRRLTVLSILGQRTNPRLSKKYKHDALYVKRKGRIKRATYGGKKY